MVFAEKYQQLIRPDRVVKILNLLVQNNLPMDETFLAALFPAYKISAERIAIRIEHLVALRPEDAQDVIHTRPSMLFVGDTILSHTLQRIDRS